MKITSSLLQGSSNDFITDYYDSGELLKVYMTENQTYLLVKNIKRVLIKTHTFFEFVKNFV